MDNQWFENKKAEVQKEFEDLKNSFVEFFKKSNIDNTEFWKLLDSINEENKWDVHEKIYNIIREALKNDDIPVDDFFSMSEKLYDLEDRCADIEKFYPYHLVDTEPQYFKGDIIITDPCYLTKDDDRCWELDELGFTNYILHDTLYGDWGCTTYNSDTKEVLGGFCADAGLVCVVLLEELNKYNPNFDVKDYVSRDVATLIKDFDGYISLKIDEEKGTFEYEGKNVDYTDHNLYVIGKGNVNFITSQTSL